MAAVEVTPRVAGRASGELTRRVVVGAVLAAVAVAATWAGGIAFTALVAAAVLLMSSEWNVMHGVRRGVGLACLIALAVAGVVTIRWSALDGIIALGVAAGGLGLFVRGVARRHAVRLAAGMLYCGLPMVALLWLRSLPDGLFVVAWLFVVVWTTDIGAYFAGRAIGGPRLAPAISPNKTWAGVAGGVAAAAIVAGIGGIAYVRAGFDSFGGDATLAAIGARAALTGAGLSCVAIGGDLFESWLKRRAGVKDSGNLLPGHGGVMDRIDGLVPVAVVAALAVALGA